MNVDKLWTEFCEFVAVEGADIFTRLAQHVEKYFGDLEKVNGAGRSVGGHWLTAVPDVPIAELAITTKNTLGKFQLENNKSWRTSMLEALSVSSAFGLRCHIAWYRWVNT